MFNFTTTHVLNADSVIEDLGNGKIRVARGLDLDKNGILNVYHKEATASTPAEIQFPAIVDLKGKRVMIELRPLDGADSTFANALVDKNKVIYVEVPEVLPKVNGVDITFVQLIQKYQLFMYGKELLVAEAGSDVKFQAAEGVDIVKAEIQKMKEVTCACTDSVVNPQPWETETEFEEANAVAEKKFVHAEGDFGTYSWLIRNLRLPTGANMAWMNINADEMPVPGCLYDQYTIHYIKNRGILGMNAVGELSRSHTVHVLYVPAGVDVSALGTPVDFDATKTVDNDPTTLAFDGEKFEGDIHETKA